MTELSQLITRLQSGISRNAPYVRTIKHPQLLVKCLKELDGLIGNDKVKDSVATQVSHLVMMKTRALKDKNIKEDEVMLNTVLYGPPGVGKTLVGTKLAKIWYSLGYLDTSNNTRNKNGITTVIGDLLKDGVGTSTTEETTLSIYILIIFIVLFVLLISIGWSFYNRFGGPLLAFVVSVLVIGIIIILLASIISSNSNNNTTNNDVTVNNTKVEENNKDVNNTNKNEFGNSPVIHDMPSDDQIIKVVTRADFVDKYVGWSDKKTIKLLEDNLGKVLFVDEAYSLVTDVHDSFGMEVLTTINLFLSQHSKEIIVVFAGYKDLMETGLFSFQPGLRRRFMWQFDCNGYTETQMFDIFKMQLSKKGWGLTDEDATKILFGENKSAFPAFGGDSERLTFFSELEHSRDYINNEKGMSIDKLTPDHIKRGLLKLQENNIQSNSEESTNPLANMMKMLRKDNGNDQNNIMDIIKSSNNKPRY